MMGCATGCVRLFLFICSFIQFLFGIVLVGVGSVIIHSGILSDVSPGTFSLIVFMIVLGAMTKIVGFLGCFGALSGNIRILKIFNFILNIDSLLMIAGGIFALRFIPKGQTLAGGVLGNAIKDYENNTVLATMVDKLQDRYQCCGKNSSQDYDKNRIPGTCCQKFTSESCDASEAFEKGF